MIPRLLINSTHVAIYIFEYDVIRKLIVIFF